MAARLAILALLCTGAFAWGPLPSWSAGHDGPSAYPSFPWPTGRPGRPTLSSSVVVASSASTTTTAKGGVPTAVVRNGTYTGAYAAGHDQDFFLGIPYAQPPLGDLRFRVPQSLNASWTGTKGVNAYSKTCVGYGGDQIGYEVSEDCLYMNVVRPAGIAANAKLPVAFWIHGGGYYMGGGVDRRYNLSFIVENSVTVGKPMIAVSINYRLSAWGFLASKEVIGSGNTNLGLRDQRLALNWVQENIAAFGGDPAKVTIWGESAGASAVGFHLVAYGGRDDKIFRGAMMESGNPVPYQSLYSVDFYEPLYQNITANVSCADAIDTLDCLRHVPYAQLNAAINTSYVSAWYPIVDGDFVERLPSIQLAKGEFVHVPVISGANSDEGTSFSPSPVNTTAALLTYIETSRRTGMLRPALAQQLVDAYPDDPCVGIPATLGCANYGPPQGVEYRRSAAIFGDSVFIANRRLTCQTWAAAGVPAYCYRFNARAAGSSWQGGVGHFQEVAFVFDNTNGVGYATNPFANLSQSYLDLASLMSKSWVSFVVDQDPNSYRASQGYASLGQWPVYTNDVNTAQDFVFDANVTSHAELDNYRAAGMAKVNQLNIAYSR